MKHFSVARAMASILVCVGAATSANSAQPGADQSGIFPPGSRPYGQSYEQWSARWWQWGLAEPVNGHPFVNSPDFQVSRGQSGQVWFLGAPVGEPSERTCQIPAGKALFVGMVNSEWSSLEGFATEAEQRENAIFFGNHIRDLFCILDGRAVQNLGDFRFQSPQFTFTAPTPWIFGNIGGTGTSVADGYYVFLQPLSVGHHELHFGGAFHFSVAEGDPFDLDAAVDMTYHLTVSR